MHTHYATEHLYSRFLLSDGVSIDTRTLRPGQLFFALSGQQDGHRFVQEALGKGASYAIISDTSLPKDPRHIYVSDVLEALQQLAHFHRSQYKRSLIAITGSNGKTTTRSLLAHILSQKYVVHASVKSYNNHIGVPLTLLGILPQTDVAVVELGSSQPGEIGFLCEMTRPTHGVLTHVGKAHLAGLGGEKGVFLEKKRLFDYLSTTGGCFFRNSNYACLQPLVASKGKLYSFPLEADDYPVRCLATYPRLRFRLPSGTEGEVNLFGSHNFNNLATAIAVAQHVKVADSDIITALSTWEPVPQRCEWLHHKGRQLLMDAYNANPDSMQAMLQAFSELPQPHKVVILGDMLELGKHSAGEHTAIGKQIAALNAFDQVLLCGTEMAMAAKQLPQAHYFRDKKSLIKYLHTHPLPPHCPLLLKASRGMALETILAHL